MYILLLGEGTSASRALGKIENITNTQWTRLIITFEIDETMMDNLENNNLRTRFECTTANTSGTYQYWCAPQLELGSIATTYAPAPEDSYLKTEVETIIEQTANSITTSVNEQLTLYATLENLSDMEDKIINEEVVDLLKSYVTTTDLENNLSGYTTSDELDTALKAYVTSAEMSTTVEQTQESIISEVNTTLEGYVTTINLDNTLSSYSTTLQMNSAIDQVQNSILLTVSETYATSTDLEDVEAIANDINTNLASNYYTKIETDSKISQTANSIELLTEQVNSITGDNSIKNGEFNSDLDNWITSITNNSSANGSIEVVNYNDSNYAELVCNKGTTSLEQYIEGLFADIDYTLSFSIFDNGEDLKIADNGSLTVKIYQENSNSEELTKILEQVIDITEKEQTISIDFNLVENAVGVYIMVELSSNKYLSIGLSAMITNVILSGGSTVEKFALLNVNLSSIESTVSEKVDETEVCSVISQSSEEISLKGNRITIDSDNFTLDQYGYMTAKSATLTNVEISSSNGDDEITLSNGAIKTKSSNGYKGIEIVNQAIDVYSYNDENNFIGTVRSVTDSSTGRQEMIVAVDNGDVLSFGYQKSDDDSTWYKSIEINTDNSGTVLFHETLDMNDCQLKNAKDPLFHTYIGSTYYEGYAATGLNNNHKYLLSWEDTYLDFYVDATYVGTLSDKRLKNEIEDINEDFIQAIKEVEMKQFKVANRNGLISFGILAQDLMEIFEKYGKNPFDYEIVRETKYRTDDDTIYYAINYEQFLILKQKATDKIIENLEKRIEELEGK